MLLLTLREELYSSDKDKDESIEHDGNNGVEVSDSEDTKNDERSDSENRDKGVDDTTSQSIVIQKEKKDQGQIRKQVVRNECREGEQ